MKNVKVVYSDDGRDKAIHGEKVDEDDLFITIIDKNGCSIQIAKRSIVLIKELD